MSETRTGLGCDVHRLIAGRPLILGGVTIPSEFGLGGHSDADVLAHAITDAILGAAALGDIGMHFSDLDPRWKGCDSLLFLRHARQLAEELRQLAGQSPAGFPCAAVCLDEELWIFEFSSSLHRDIAGCLTIPENLP